MTDAAPPTSEEYPLLVVAPGMTFADVRRASSTPLDAPRDPAGAWMAQPDGPHRVRIRHRNLGFELPPGLFTLVEAKRRVVESIRVTAHLGYLGRDQAFEALDALHELFTGKGWEARTRYGPDRLAPMLAKQREVHAAVYRPLPDIREKVDPSQHWHIDVVVRRTVDGDSPEARRFELPGDGFLLTTLLVDDGRTG